MKVVRAMEVKKFQNEMPDCLTVVTPVIYSLNHSFTQRHLTPNMPEETKIPKQKDK